MGACNFAKKKRTWYVAQEAEAYIANRVLSLAWKGEAPHVDILLADCRVSRVASMPADKGPVLLSVTDWDSVEVARIRVVDSASADRFEQVVHLHATNHNEEPRNVVATEELTRATSLLGFDDVHTQRLVVHALVWTGMLVRIRSRPDHYFLPSLLPRTMNADVARGWCDPAFEARHARQYVVR